MHELRTRLTAAAARLFLRLLLKDFFVGPVSRLPGVSEGPLTIAANHLWWIDQFVGVILSSRLGRTFNVIVSERLGRRFGPFGKLLGNIPLSSTPLGTAKALTTALAPNSSALWIYPQAGFVPSSWSRHSGISSDAWSTVTFLSRTRPLLPLQIDVIHVQSFRPITVVTVGEIISAGTGSSKLYSESFARLAMEAEARLKGATSEYTSLLHTDGALVWSYPVRLARLNKQLGTWLCPGAAVDRKPDGWAVNIDEAVDQARAAAALETLLPSMLAKRLSSAIEIGMASHGPQPAT